MRLRQRVIAGLLILAVLLLAVFSMWIILLRMRPIDPEMLRAPAFSQIEMFDVAVAT
ncbi:hypothetical protein [Parvibaculum sp.]|uniref:hypothetical protein n=1 Tax=Parvibaculum sp. TaxID=2024848 RepID=UPI00391B8291